MNTFRHSSISSDTIAGGAPGCSIEFTETKESDRDELVAVLLEVSEEEVSEEGRSGAISVGVVGLKVVVVVSLVRIH